MDTNKVEDVKDPKAVPVANKKDETKKKSLWAFAGWGALFIVVTIGAIFGAQYAAAYVAGLTVSALTLMALKAVIVVITYVVVISTSYYCGSKMQDFIYQSPAAGKEVPAAA